MIVNACVKSGKMVDENICRDCEVSTCRHAGELITRERLDMGIYGSSDYWNGEADSNT